MTNEQYQDIKNKVEEGYKITSQEKTGLEKLIDGYQNLIIDLTNRGDVKQALYMNDAKMEIIEVINKSIVAETSEYEERSNYV